MKNALAPQNYKHEGLEKFYQWVLSFLTKEKWMARRMKVEDELVDKLRSIITSVSVYDESYALGGFKDVFGWYFYLVESMLFDITKYDPVEGARIAPIFLRLAEDFDFLIKVKGLSKKVRKLTRDGNVDVDSILFEMLAALNWSKCGWEVEFLEEDSKARTPDLRVTKGDEEIFVECKRLARHSELSITERQKVEKMLWEAKEILLQNCLLVDIVFHVNVQGLDDLFLYDMVLKLLSYKSKRILSNKQATIKIRAVDFGKIRHHLFYFRVKALSPQIGALILGPDYNETYRICGVDAIYARVGEAERGNNYYISEIRKAFGLTWTSDAEESLSGKSRDVKRQLVSACGQFPAGKRAVVHIGLETLDQTLVEIIRRERIFKTITAFQTEDKLVECIYVHLFQTYAPGHLEECWIVDESHYWFVKEAAMKSPLEQCSFIIPFEKYDEGGIHWLKPLP